MAVPPIRKKQPTHLATTLSFPQHAQTKMKRARETSEGASNDPATKKMPKSQPPSLPPAYAPQREHSLSTLNTKDSLAGPLRFPPSASHILRRKKVWFYSPIQSCPAYTYVA